MRMLYINAHPQTRTSGYARYLPRVQLPAACSVVEWKLVPTVSMITLRSNSANSLYNKNLANFSVVPFAVVCFVH